MREILYEAFSIAFATVDKCPKPRHQHAFFELVYIQSGTGIQIINESKFGYQPGHLFLLTPEDFHSFDVETTTEFFFLQFNDIYIKNSGLLSDNVRRLEYILQNANHRPGCILKNKPDKEFVKPIVEAIMREYVNRDLYNEELVHQLVNTLIIIVARNIAKYLPENITTTTEGKAVDILQYIQHHIYYPERLKAKKVSDHFGISNAYLGRYFKKHTNETMQQYIINYKTKLIEHRLKFSDKRINEIADEFGFTDESHLNKYFSKQKGSSPNAYRKLVRT